MSRLMMNQQQQPQSFFDSPINNGQPGNTMIISAMQREIQQLREAIENQNEKYQELYMVSLFWRCILSCLLLIVPIDFPAVEPTWKEVFGEYASGTNQRIGSIPTGTA